MQRFLYLQVEKQPINLMIYQQFIMKLPNKIILLLFLVSTLQAAKEITVSCGPDSECSSGYSGQYVGDGVEFTQCLDYECSLQGQMTVEVTPCETDISNQPCSTKTCFYLTSGNIDMCLDQNQPCSAYGSTQSTTVMSCGDCEAGSNCTQKCSTIEMTSSDYNINQTFCQSECFFTYMSVSMMDCSTDSFDNPCSCCSQMEMEGMSDSMGVCTYGTPFGTSKVSSYAAGTLYEQMQIIKGVFTILLVFLLASF